MKGLVWNCKSVDCTYDDGMDVSEECLLVYVCCEKGDSLDDARESARRILQLNKKRFEKHTIVIFPFAHMSNEIMDSVSARVLINEIVNKLSKKNLVRLLRFNQKKELKIHLLPENEDVSYFSY